MDLARDEETRVRNLGRLALEKAAKAGASKAGSNGISRTFATVSRVNGDGTIDVSMGDYTDVNGVTSECILRGLRMTVACSSAQVGDRVIVDTYAHVSVVTGILANADNTHYVNWDDPIWEGCIGINQSAKIPELKRSRLFIFDIGNADPNKWPCIVARTASYETELFCYGFASVSMTNDVFYTPHFKYVDDVLTFDRSNVVRVIKNDGTTVAFIQRAATLRAIYAIG